MPGGLVRPEIRAVLAWRRASSDCCAAPLDGGPDVFTCSACGEACGRVLSDPVEVTAHG